MHRRIHEEQRLEDLQITYALPVGWLNRQKGKDMTNYFIKIATYGTNEPMIIDETTMEQAERGENHLNPDDFMFHCEANTMEEAAEQYLEEFSQIAFDRIAETMHP